MALTFPREIYFDMWLGEWVNIAGAVRENPGITITPGRGNEQGRTTPNTITFRLKNGADLPAPFSAGDFTPNNPAGQFYGLLGRNTPVRGGVVVARDTCTRTVVDGLGSADTGEAWTLSGTAANFDVNGSAATVVIAGATDQRRAYLADLDKLGDCEVIADFTMTTPVNGQDTMSILLRGQSLTNYVAVDVDVTNAGVVRIAIRDTDDNTYLVAPTTVTGVSVASPMRLHALVEENTVRGKVYNPSTTDEPYDWPASAYTGNMSRQGWPGWRAQTGSGNTNVTFTMDNYVVRISRVAGLTADIRPRWDGTAQHKWVEITAGSTLRRLGQGKPPKRSAIERFVVNHATQPVAYWPLDDEELANAGRIAAGSGSEAISNFISTTGPTVNFTPGRAFGNGRLATWLKPGLNIDHGSYLRCALLTPYSGSWTVHFAAAFSGRYTTTTEADSFTVGNLTTGFWTFHCYSFAQEIGVVDPNGNLLATISVAIFDDGVHHLGFRATQDGADVDWSLIVDGAVASSGTVASLTNPEIVRIAFQQNVPDGGRNRAIGHVALYSGNGPDMADVYDAIFGHPGELAGRRAERVCGEDGITFEHVGSLDETAAMGPQPAESTLAILRDCEETDRGTLFEPRSVIGVGYRTLASLYNQARALVLDYSAGQLSDSLHPIDDDQQIRNYITVKRRHGGQATAIQESGPLNVNDPGDDPDGVGVYEGDATVNVESDDQLPYVAGHLLRLGTASEDRFPKVTVNLATSAIDGSTDQELSVLTVNIDDRYAIDDLVSVDIYGSVDQLARGYTEQLSAWFHKITFNTAPSSPYTSFTLDSDRPDSETSTLLAAVDTDDTSLVVQTVAEGNWESTLWTTDAADMPIPISVNGEQMSVTAITGGISFVAAGSAAHAVNASVTPGYPAGVLPGDLVLILAAIRNSGTGTPNLPAGWTTIIDASNMRVFGKIAAAGDGAQQVTFSGGVANADTSAQMAAFRGVGLTPVGATPVGSTLNASAQDIAVAQLDFSPELHQRLNIHFGWKQDDWTSVAEVANGIEIGEPDTTSGDDQGIVWNYRIITPIELSRVLGARTFVVTGGAAAISRGAAAVWEHTVQTFTVTRNVNSLPGGKSHAVGDQVRLTTDAALALQGQG